MKTDIKNRADIVKLVDVFYAKIQSNEEIGYFFNDVAKVNWSEHLPKMYDFWENILFSTGDYNGNPMTTHQELHKKSKMNKELFQFWNVLFNETVDGLFVGEKAEEIKQRTANIAAAMMFKTLE